MLIVRRESRYPRRRRFAVSIRGRIAAQKCRELSSSPPRLVSPMLFPRIRPISPGLLFVCPVRCVFPVSRGSLRPHTLVLHRLLLGAVAYRPRFGRETGQMRQVELIQHEIPDVHPRERSVELYAG
jgi:hypothetical protein